MIRKISITIIAGTDLLYQIYEEVKDHIYPPARKECIYTGHGNLKLILDEDSPAYKTVLHICKNNHLHPHIAQWVHYSSGELMQAKFFKLSIPSPLELEGTDASDYGTIYSNSCPFCDIGRKAVGDILVDRKFLRKYKIGCLHPEVFVSEDIKRLIEDNNFTGISFAGPIKDYKNRDIPLYYVLNITNVLPPMSSTTWLCPTQHPLPQRQECGHQILYLRSDIQYEAHKLNDACDFNLTHEYLDNYRTQEIIISNRVRECFRHHKIRAGYFPVALL